MILDKYSDRPKNYFCLLERLNRKTFEQSIYRDLKHLGSSGQSFVHFLSAISKMEVIMKCNGRRNDAGCGPTVDYSNGSNSPRLTESLNSNRELARKIYLVRMVLGLPIYKITKIPILRIKLR